MFAISDRWAAENAKFCVKSMNEVVFKRLWLLNSENSDMMSDSFEVITSEFLVNMSLDCEMKEADVKVEKTKFSWVSNDRSRANNIRSTRFAEITNDENFSRSDNLKSEKLLVKTFLNDSLKCLDAKLDDKFKTFS
jgi:hypothetical protein